jgi:RNA polymerase primary sigma factor
MTKRIFISYSHDSESHQANVLNLADKLNKNGLDCNIDLYFPNPLEGWPRWIERMINESDYVIIVLSKGYYEKLDKNLHESNLGKGVVFEMTQILQELYNSKAFNKKFIPIVFDSRHEQYITRAFNSYTYYNLNTDDGYIMLYRHITDQQLHTKPNKGKIQNLGALNNYGNELFTYDNSDNNIAVDVETARIELTIDGDFDKFSYECKQKLLRSISELLEMDEANVYIKRIKAGSIQVLLELPSHKAIELQEKISLGLLKNYKIKKAEILVDDIIVETQVPDSRYLKFVKQFTNRETLSINKYLHEIEEVDLITAEEEVELAKRIKKGDKVALERMIKANLRFVVSVAKQYQNQGLSLPDLINEGNLGLIKAAQRYDETCGFRFVLYGVWWILRAILQALAEQARIARYPLNKIEFTRINKTFSRLEQEYQIEPTDDEIALLIETSSNIVEEALKISSNHISLNSPIDNIEKNNLYDYLSKENTVVTFEGFNKIILEEIEQTLTTFDEREANIIRYYFGISGHRQHTIEEIGDEFELNRVQVRKIKEKIIKQIKDNYRIKLLKKYI